ncbi:ATP-binding cassette domain-containing protein [bacterium]|nr:ATP-binding cassette domain-containing protein [bacterium]
MSAVTSAQPLVQVQGLKKHFNSSKLFFSKKVKTVKAVDGVSFEIKHSETLGLVGESGCGKSTTGKCILRLIESTDGDVFFGTTNLSRMDQRRFRPYRRHLQIIFQDPFSSLNPRMHVESMLREILHVHQLAEGESATRRVNELLEMVGLSSAQRHKYPHEFSGGQRQRIGIARALAVEPKFIVCDEPVSALDVSIQAQIINLLVDLQKQLSLTYLFIAHDLAVVRHISNRVAVMYLGKVVEMADTRQLYINPLHPYTQSLLSAVPTPDPVSKKQRIVLKGEIPNPADPPSGCTFHTRCPIAKQECKEIHPELREIEKDHFVSCHLAN